MCTKFIVIPWDRSGCSKRLPGRNPATHPKEVWVAPDDKLWQAMVRDREDAGLDSDPLGSSYCSRKAGLERKQRRYFRRFKVTHFKRCQLLTEGHDTHRSLTCDEDLWWKRQKVAKWKPWESTKAVHRVVRKGRIARKEAARRGDDDYMSGMWGRDRGQARCRPDRKLF